MWYDQKRLTAIDNSAIHTCIHTLIPRPTYICNAHTYIVNVKVESEARTAAGTDGKRSTLRDDKKLVLSFKFMPEGVD